MPALIIRRVLDGVLGLFLASFALYSIIVLTPNPMVDALRALRSGSFTLSNDTLYVGGRAFNAQMLYSIHRDAPSLGEAWPLTYFLWLFDPNDRENYIVTDRIVPRGIDLQIGDFHFRGAGALTGDLGRCWWLPNNVPVTELIGQRFGATLVLALLALCVSLLIAFPLGLAAAVKQSSTLDRLVVAGSSLGLAVPTPWLAMLLFASMSLVPQLLRLSDSWNWLPYLPLSDVSDLDQEGNLANRLYHLILPVAALSVGYVAWLTRFVRALVLWILNQPYILTAWTKGAAPRKIILRHALRNALWPTLALAVRTLPILFFAAILVETVFQYQGIGYLFYIAVSSLDMPLIIGLTMFFLLIVAICRLISDLLLVLADPRGRRATTQKRFLARAHNGLSIRVPVVPDNITRPLGFS